MDIIREMPDIELTFTADSNYKILIKSSFGEYKLSGQSKTEYPSVPLVESEQKIKMDNAILKRMIEKTIFACSTDNLRPALTGVFLQIFEQEIRMVATDGLRLVKTVRRNSGQQDFTKEIIIPTKALNFVARNLEEQGSQIITFSENHVLFEMTGTNIYTRIINEPFPDYERVIPQNYSKEMLIAKDDFVSSVKRVSLFSNPMTYQVRLIVETDKLTVHAQDIDFGGEANETISCKFDSEPLEIAYNANYLLDILRHLDSEEIKFLVEDEDGPGIIVPFEQEEKEEILMLIMPVRLNS
jgi:DNA polymerase-3 subunit beta